jgi:hypothetical protein
VVLKRTHLNGGRGVSTPKRVRLFKPAGMVMSPHRRTARIAGIFFVEGRALDVRQTVTADGKEVVVAGPRWSS